ncbi:MAG TPA: M1 family metallopeptidase, partial [Puia sp.]|nr:M1 family metallopeptidase [Puia sp.]
MKWLSPMLLCFILAAISPRFADGQTDKGYDPHETFDPLFFTHNGNEYRSADGSPGPAYWQNRADYVIHASLDTAEFKVSGTVDIQYTNNSPHQLTYLWLQLEQNLYKQSSIGALSEPAGGLEYGPKDFTGGYTIKEVAIKDNGTWHKAMYTISDTRMQVSLAKDLAAKGGKAELRITYEFKIPKNGVDIMGRTKTRNGWIFEVAQWYPRMEVYDDVNGWNSLPFVGAGEFYLDFGDFDVYLTVPRDQVVVASGKLENPQEVLTSTEMERLREAGKSDKTVYIIKPGEINDPKTRPVHNGLLTWHFKIQNSREFSWACSKAFIWDAARVNLPNGHQPLAMSVYPIESNGKDQWSRSTEYLKFSMEFYSKLWKFDYPWPNAVTVAGGISGEEYPSIVFCSMRARNAGLFSVTTHEIGHNWFPMVVGSDERRYAWMDEGFNTFQNYYSKEFFNNGEYAPRRTPVNEIMEQYKKDNAQPILTYVDRIKEHDLDYLAYDKPAAGLYLLREAILGPERFDVAFKTYVHRWAYKHPKPEDFFRTMNDASGSDLNWFWKGWFYNNWKLDQAVTKVSYKDNDPAKGAIITIVNKDKLVMPVTLKIVMKDGSTDSLSLPF